MDVVPGIMCIWRKYRQRQVKFRRQRRKTARSNVDDGLLDINRASVADFMTLPGIGQSKAEALFQYREAHGRFSSIEEIMNVDGIKEGVFNKIKDSIKV